jgi:hypothetical protein
MKVIMKLAIRLKSLYGITVKRAQPDETSNSVHSQRMIVKSFGALLDVSRYFKSAFACQSASVAGAIYDPRWPYTRIRVRRSGITITMATMVIVPRAHLADLVDISYLQYLARQ